SIGVTCLSATQDEYFDEVFARADKALYQAKQQGRNQVVTLPP
ncbi:MAG: diguanylate cyclase, partial [Gammaproteobacteria bacterium]|nr:diguanylate cyclase [Gammaproteobacteria bacterium]